MVLRICYSFNLPLVAVVLSEKSGEIHVECCVTFIVDFLWFV